ncbi:hypothetical protein ACOME3_001614 [Neoechinorhynchus agilis]
MSDNNYNQLRDLYRDIGFDLDANQSIYAIPAGEPTDGLERLLLLLQSTFPSLKKLSDQYLAATDASLTRRISSIGSIRTIMTQNPNDADRLDRYLSCLRKWKSQGVDVWTKVASYDVSGGTNFNGFALQRIATSIKYLDYGKENEVRIKRKRTAHRSTEKDQELMVKELKSNARVSHKPESAVEDLYEKLSTSFKSKKVPIQSIDLVDRTSFAKTVENYFNLSFLISEKCVKVSQEGRGDLSFEVKEYDVEQDTEESPRKYVHGVILLNGKDWKKTQGANLSEGEEK